VIINADAPCSCPGMVYTPMMYGPGMSEDARESRKNRSLLKTEGTGWDVSMLPDLTKDSADIASLCTGRRCCTLPRRR